MNIGSTDVAPSSLCFLTHQCLLLLCKNSIVDVPIVYMFQIIICANCSFSLYAFLSAHSEDDDECGGNFIANG
jgi:hypothetical protein